MPCDESIDAIAVLQQKIGYSFRNKDLAREALTHASRSHDGPNNERLEFLGDAVLQIIVSNHLFLTYPELAEGELSRTRAAVVSAPSLKKVAEYIGLSQFLLLDRGMELSGGRENANILADAVEALIAAIYLDGGIQQATDFILPRLRNAIEEEVASGIRWDSKSKLQEILQRNGDIKIEYVVDDVAGPAHDRLFTVSVLVQGQPLAQGSGRRKKDAQQDAARRAVEVLERTSDEGGNNHLALKET